jgi:tetratricopeptide (TPR) repeat protein
VRADEKLTAFVEVESARQHARSARANFIHAREALQKELKQQADNPLLTSFLAQTLAGLGEREAALREADRAVGLLPSSRDAKSGPFYESIRARIQARFGDGNRAIPVLKHLLATPYSPWVRPLLTPALLQLDPDFDQIRSDPRFQELCQDKQP